MTQNVFLTQNLFRFVGPTSIPRFLKPFSLLIILLFLNDSLHAQGTVEFKNVSVAVSVDDSVELRLVGDAADAYLESLPGASKRNLQRPDGPIGLHGKIARKKGTDVLVEAYVVLGRDGDRPILITLNTLATAREFEQQPPFTDEEAKQKGTPAFVIAAIRKRRSRPLLSVSDQNRLQIRHWTIAPGK